MASSKALAMVKQNSSGSINNPGPTSSNGSSSTSIHSHGRESRASSKDSTLGSQQNPAPGPVSESQVSNHGDSDLFSFLSAMHLNHHQIPVTQQLITSRKRKILDHGDRGSLGGSSSGKFNGLRPPPTLRRNSEDDLPLHTPQCSQSGYADEEDRHIQQVENANAATSASTNESHPSNEEDGPPSPSMISPQGISSTANNLSDTQVNVNLSSDNPTRITRNRHASNNISLSLVTPHALMSEIDENLAADFDGSFSGLGVDINASSYSMSEALLALPNLSISSSGHIFKQEILSPTTGGPLGKDAIPPIMYFKEEPNSVNQSPISMVSKKNGSNNKTGSIGKVGVSRGGNVTSKRQQKIASATAQNLEALDLSNDEAHLPETSGNHMGDGKTPSTSAQKISFIGSVSRESSCEGGIGNNPGNQQLYNTTQILLNLQPSSGNVNSVNNSNYNSAVNLSGSHPNLSLAGASVPAIAPSSQESTTKKSQPSFGGQIRLASTGTGHNPTTKTHKVILPLQSSNDNINQAHSDLLPIVPGAVQGTNIVTNKKVAAPTNRKQVQNNDVPTAPANEATNNYTLPSTLLNGPGLGLDEPNDTFQYILAAATSNATKLNEPSITYLNQGQAYELRLKKLGDLSPYRGNKNRLLRCKVRICFHERRLQYMELEQLTEWSSKHVNERVLDLDVPLSYGMIDPYVPQATLGCDPTQLNVLTFRWDPTRDTGVFIKVNCISTEFTPKKHGGEKGVPFRLQVETYTDDSGTAISADSWSDYERRLHAASCILQIFKLKGADRKHKQDRDKIHKRPFAEQEKFSPSYECTVLTDLPPEHIYVPSGNSSSNNSTSNTAIPLASIQMGQGAVNSSRSNTPNRVTPNHPTTSPVTGSQQPISTVTTPLKRADSTSPSFQNASKNVTPKNVSSGIYQQTNSSECIQILSRNGSPGVYVEEKFDINAFEGANGMMTDPQQSGSDFNRFPEITSNSTPDMVTHWLRKNRYSNHLNSFKQYNGRDILRLLREEIISLCGIVDGIRLYNDLHMAVVAPVCTFYVASKDSDEFSALFLEEATTTEFIKKIAQSIGVPASVFRNLYIIGPHGILIKVTDSVVQYTKPESVFQFSLRSSQNHPLTTDLQNIDSDIAKCDVILENTTPSLGVTNEMINIHAHPQNQVHQVNNTSAEINGGEQHMNGLQALNPHHQQQNISRNISPFPRNGGGNSMTNENTNVGENHDNNVRGNHSSAASTILQH